jgi:hypothetical protein
MSKIVRYEFVGSWLWFWLMSISVIGIPFAILYFVNGLLRLDSEMPDPEGFVRDFKAGRYRS